MKMQHECRIPKQEVPYNVSWIKAGWTCPICGERWEISYRRSGYTASRMRPLLRVIKHWRWHRDAKREMRESGLL